MLRNRSTSLKLEKQYSLLFIRLLCAQRINDNDVVAVNDPHSRVWTICSGFDAIDLTYEPIGIVLLLGFLSCGGEGD